MGDVDLSPFVTILILIDGFLQSIKHKQSIILLLIVTILILIDGFLQYYIGEIFLPLKVCHNPYFNRWFSAIKSSEQNHN